VQGTVDGTQLRPSAEVSVTAAEGPAEVAVRLSATSVAQGGTVQVDASGFASGEAVQVWLHSEPRLLATTTADGTGRISVTVRIPAGTPAGAHTVVVSSAAASGSAALQVTAFTLGATAPLWAAGSEQRPSSCSWVRRCSGCAAAGRSPPSGERRGARPGMEPAGPRGAPRDSRPRTERPRG